jgi:hypothetical protein
MGVHVNNAGEFPVFSLGDKGTACDPSLLAGGRSAVCEEVRKSGHREHNRRRGP